MKKWMIIFVIIVAVVPFLFSSCSTGGGLGDLYIIAAVGISTLSTVGSVMLGDGGLPFFGGTPVEDASVTVNGTNLPHAGFGIYAATLTGISAGDTVTLTVTRGGESITANVTMPYAPTTIAPPGPFTVTSAINFTWAIAQQPQQYDITIDAAYCQLGSDYDATELGPATSHLLPANTLKTLQTGVELEIAATNTNTAITGAGSGSTFGAVNVEVHTFNTN